MREKKKYLVITFATTTAAMAFESACHQAGRDGRMIPVPKDISAGCGLAWRTSSLDKGEWESFLEQSNLKCEQMTELMLF